MQILLVRHAQSEWNATGRWQGWADPPLSEGGVAEARAAALPEGLGEIVASDLRRAAETAEIIAGEPVRTFRGLRERSAGVWTGLTRAEIEEGWPGVLGTDVVIPGGETRASVVARAVATLARLVAEHRHDTVLAVTHGALIGALAQHLGEERVALPNLSGRWFAIDPSGSISAGAVVSLLPTSDPVPG